MIIPYSVEPELEGKTLQNLGMPKEQDGDRLTPLSALLEVQSNSSSFEGETLMPAFNNDYRKLLFLSS